MWEVFSSSWKNVYLKKKNPLCTYFKFFCTKISLPFTSHVHNFFKYSYSQVPSVSWRGALSTLVTQGTRGEGHPISALGSLVADTDNRDMGTLLLSKWPSKATQLLRPGFKEDGMFIFPCTWKEESNELCRPEGWEGTSCFSSWRKKFLGKEAAEENTLR